MLSEQQTHPERQTLLSADNKTGFFGVSHNKRGQLKPYQARVKRGGKDVHLGCFATAEEAALCVARSPEGQAAAAERATAAPPLTSEQARQQAQAEGLTLLVACNKGGYFGVRLANPGYPKPFQARVSRGGRRVYLGSFTTAEEAALCVARSPEAQVAVGKAAADEKAAAAPPLTGEDDGGDDVGEEGEEEIQVLDAVEVLVASDDYEEEEALAMEAEEVTLVYNARRGKEAREGEHAPRRRGASR